MGFGVWGGGVWTTIVEADIVVWEIMTMKRNHEDTELIGNWTVAES